MKTFAATWILLAAALGLFAADDEQALIDNLRMDPHKIVGPEDCGECHKDEIAAWKLTHHSKSFFELTRREEAREIAEKLGLKRIKRESDCLTCHFTTVVEDDEVKPIAGTSCESCHGAAAEWKDIHNDYGGKDLKKEDETPAHRAERIAKTKALGMIRAEDIYAVAANCYQCHTVPNERLVNVGGHKAGSRFELVSWSQGEVRHNFFRSESGKDNIPSSTQRLRLMYVTGLALDLEYGLRAVANATEKDTFAVAQAKRVQAAVKKLEEAQALINDPQIAAAIAAGKEAKLKLNNHDQLIEMATTVQNSIKTFLGQQDGSRLAALDSLLPKPEDYKGEALQ